MSDLFDTDYPAEIIVDYAIGWREKWPTLTCSEMIEFVGKIVDVEGTEAEIHLMVTRRLRPQQASEVCLTIE